MENVAKYSGSKGNDGENHEEERETAEHKNRLDFYGIILHNGYGTGT
jgi:hypothetical protein